MLIAILQILALKQSIATLIVALTEEDFSIAGLGAKVTDIDSYLQVVKHPFHQSLTIFRVVNFT